MEAMLRQLNFSAANTELILTESKLKDIRANTSSDPATRNAWIDTLILAAEIRPLKSTYMQEPCEIAREALTPLIKNTMDFKILAMWVKANTCLDRLEDAKWAKEKLSKMAYLSPNYLEYIYNHPQKKAIP